MDAIGVAQMMPTIGAASIFGDFAFFYQKQKYWRKAGKSPSRMGIIDPSGWKQMKKKDFYGTDHHHIFSAISPFIFQKREHLAHVKQQSNKKNNGKNLSKKI